MNVGLAIQPTLSHSGLVIVVAAMLIWWNARLLALWQIVWGPTALGRSD